MIAPTLESLQRSRPRRWAVVAVLTASLLVITMDMTILNIAIPQMSEELTPTSDQLLWIVDVYSLVLAGLLVSWAAVADRWGRKRMLMLGYIIFGATSLLVLWATSAEAVIALRALLGVGGAMIMPTTLSLIRVTFTNAKERATALSVWAAVSALGAAAGPLIGGVLLEHFSWHAAFLVNVPLMAAAILAGAVLLPESRVSNPGRWDWVGALLSFAGMILVIWAIKEFGRLSSLASMQGWIALTAGLALLWWFVARCLGRPDPLLQLHLFRNRPFSAGIIAALGSMFALGAALLLLSQWIQLVHGASPFEAGLWLAPAAVTGAIASLAAPVVARWIGTRAVVAGGVGAAGIGFLAIGMQPGELSVGTILLAMVLIGIGQGALAVGSAMIMLGTPPDSAGSAGALEETSYEVGAVLGVTVIGSIAGMIYRANLSAAASLADLTASQASLAHESLGSALIIAEASGSEHLAHDASVAFTGAMQAGGVLGGIIMLASAVLVFFLTPKGTDIAAAEH